MTDPLASEERLADFGGLRLLFLRHALPVWLFDPQWLNVIAVNPAATALYGYPEAEFLRLTMAEIVFEEELGGFLRSIEPRSRQNAGGRRWRHRCRDGRLILVDIRIEHQSYRGRPALLAIVQGTEGPAQEALALSAPAVDPATIRRVIEADNFVPFVVFDSRAAGMPVVYVNAAFEKLTGHAASEILGSDGRVLSAAAQGRPALREVERAIAAGAACAVRIESRRKDGSHAVDDVRYAPIRDHTGTPTHYVRMQTDATAQVRSAAKLRQTEDAMRDQEAAEIKSRTKTEFLARLSHELRTPLNAVIGFSELLARQEGSTDPNQARYLEQILDAGRHLLSLVDDVLDLQRIEERRIPLLPRALDLASFIADETTLLLPLLARQNLTMHIEVPAGLVVSADERCLRQVLVNLATNAIKYNRPSGAVRWTASVVRPGFAVLRISDTGPGMSGEQIPRLFHPFDRLGKEASTHEGTGLGLLIAKGLVEHMGGRLDIESKLGVGTQVLVELPLAEPHSLFGDLDPAGAADAGPGQALRPAVPGDPSVSAQSKLMPSIRLLYVEDNRINAMLFEAVLGSRPDIELRIAETGWEALDIVESWVPDVLVLDANLPDIHGIRLLRQMRELPSLKNTPAFMCSADALEEDVRLARAAGFSDYWTKPVDFNKVISDLRGLSRDARPAETR